MAFQSEFYGNKSVQKSYNFSVSMVDDANYNFKYLPDNQKIPKIKDYHAINVSVPFYDFKKEVQYYGPFPRSFPVLSTDGFELSIVFEEDEEGTIARLVDWLQKRIIVNDGTGRYVPPGLNKITFIDVNLLDDRKNIVSTYKFPDCYFLKANNVTLDYTDNNSTKYEIIFGSDFQYFNNIKLK